MYRKIRYKRHLGHLLRSSCWLLEVVENASRMEAMQEPTIQTLTLRILAHYDGCMAVSSHFSQDACLHDIDGQPSHDW